MLRGRKEVNVMTQLLLPDILGEYREVWIEVIFRMSFRTRYGRLVRSHTYRPCPIIITVHNTFYPTLT